MTQDGNGDLEIDIVEQQVMQLMRRNQADIGEIEHIKMKKENNSRDILN